MVAALRKSFTEAQRSFPSRSTQVAREIREAHVQVVARQKQINVAEQGVQAAVHSYQLNIERIKEAKGLPIEALQSIQALDQARREYLRSVIDYNSAQFSLLRALGWPDRECN